jgi:hypothetical protein
VTAKGNTGHGSRFIDCTAVEQIIGVTNKALQFRKEQKDILHGVDAHAGCSHAVVKKKVARAILSLLLSAILLISRFLEKFGRCDEFKCDNVA